MTIHVVYVIGAPGAGKTTMVTGALALLGREPITLARPVPHVRYGDIWHLGRHREQFGGTDSLSMSIQPQVTEWLHQMTQANTETPRVLIGEGDRLANNKFFDTIHACGHNLTLIHLDLPPTTARQRAINRGTNQPITWWKGRLTKVNNLVSTRRTTTYNATDHPTTLARQLATLINPPH